MVKCVECGYLATRNIKSRQLEEMEAEYRKIGMNPNELGSLYDAPICFAQAYDLKSEQWKVWQSRNTPGIVIDHDPGITQADIIKVITKERECKSFTEWKQGSTPKEHRDILDRQRQLEQEGKRRKSDRTWHFIELAITLIVGAGIALIAAYISKGH